MIITAKLRVARRSATVASFLTVLVASAGASRAQFSDLYAFGDSLSDRGNTYNELAKYFSDEHIYDLVGYTVEPGRYDDGRWSNGTLWVEHLSDQLGLPTLARNNGTQPLSMGTDFAYGGSTSGVGYTELVLSNLQTQVSDYVTLAGETSSSMGLYTVWSGGNDVIYYIEDGESDAPEAIDQFADTVAANISTAVTTLYNAGARHFLVPNLPALGDKPSYVDTPNQAFANSIVTAYNPKLAETIVDLREQFSDIRIAAWDVYSDFNSILQDSASFGFANVKDAAFSDSGPYPGTVVANPNDHAFWDDTHPTAPGHALLGQYAYEALTVLLIPEPTSLILLSTSVAAACGWRRLGRRQ